MFETYKPSGRFGTLTFPYLVLGVAAAVALAFVYHLLLDWIPLIYVNFLVTLFCGVGLGILGTWIVTAGHVRNTALAILIGILLAGSALTAKFYFQYRDFRNAVVNSDPDEIIAKLEIDGVELLNEEQRQQFVEKLKQDLMEKVSIFDYLKNRVDEGWNIGRRGNGAPVNGIFVYLVWLIEAGMFLYYTVTTTLSSAKEPYSEKLNEWASEEQTVMRLPITDEDMVQQIKSSQSVDELLSLPIPKTDESDTFAVYRVNSIQGQELEDAYLSVDLVELSFNNSGDQETEETPLVQHAILTSKQRKQLLENADLMQEAFQAYREAIEAEAQIANENAVDSETVNE